MTQYINGVWHKTGAALSSINPANGETIWNGYQADEESVKQAVTAARNAFPAWASLSYEERLDYLKRFTETVESRKAELAEHIAKETGKVLWDATGEAAATIGKLKFSEKAFAERTGNHTNDMGGFSANLRHKPHGVMAVFGPYNFPAHLPNGHIIPALMAGNTIVFKPSEQTPATGEWMAKIWEEIGLPAGVINLVQGEKDTGIALANANINGLLFTGSSQTGAILHKQLGGRPEIMLALEMGGNNPLIIHNIQDIDAAVYETIQSAFISSGQRCTCARRLIVTNGSYAEKFIQRLVEVSSSLTIGSYTDSPQPFMGPVINAQVAKQLLNAEEDLCDAGGVSLLAMREMEQSPAFVSPAIVDVTNVKDRIDEEWFGPLLKLIRVQDMDEAIKEANNTQYGLSAGLFSPERDAYERCLRELNAGIINWNKQTTGASGMAPFGGVGCSGNHHPAGYYSADYCAYPVASMESDSLELPEQLAAGITL